MRQKAFTLIEMLLVLLILGILFPIVSNLFKTPSKHLLDAEQCINYLDAQFNKYLFDSISWKISGWFPTNRIQIAGFNHTSHQIKFWPLSWDVQLSWDIVVWWSGVSSQIWFNELCYTPNFTVILSGGWLELTGNNYIDIDIKKNLQGDYQNPAMRIIPSSGDVIHKLTLDYLICAEWSELDECIHKDSIRFNAMTQSISSNTCLRFNKVTLECEKRSISDR